MKLVFIAILLGVQPFISIQTDGVLSEREWKGAEQHGIGDGKTILWKHDNDVLYVALKSQGIFWSHLYLSDGKRVKVMHVSAALGAINYMKVDTLWRTSDKSFVYELRDREFTAETAAKMGDYYSKNGWVANNINLGDKKTLEAKINLGEFTPRYFACVIRYPGEILFVPGRSERQHDAYAVGARVCCRFAEVRTKAVDEDVRNT